MDEKRLMPETGKWRWGWREGLTRSQYGNGEIILRLLPGRSRG